VPAFERATVPESETRCGTSSACLETISFRAHLSAQVPRRCRSWLSPTDTSGPDTGVGETNIRPSTRHGAPEVSKGLCQECDQLRSGVPGMWCAVERRDSPVGGRKSHPVTFAPAGSNRSGRGGNEAAEAFGVEDHVGDLASTQSAALSERRAGPERADVEADPATKRGRLRSLGKRAK
jgi:hypothetical protein